MQVLRGSLEKHQGRRNSKLAEQALAAVRPLAPALALLLRRADAACLQHATAALWLLTADSDAATATALLRGDALPPLIALLSHKVSGLCAFRDYQRKLCSPLGNGIGAVRGMGSGGCLDVWSRGVGMSGSGVWELEVQKNFVTM